MNKITNIKLILGSFIIALAFLIFDLIADILTTGTSEVFHLLIEGTIVVILTMQILNLVKLVFHLKSQNKKISTDLDHWRAEHNKLLKGVSLTINAQFNNWKLTPSQKEVGLLLLKGLNFQEIANIRNTAERTVRQQATGIYKKANLKGRHEFAAFFLEDLLLPN